MPPDATSSTRLFLIEQHYASMSEELAWSAARVHRLCTALNLTLPELAAFIRVRFSQFERYMLRDRFPRTVALHLLLLERAAFRNTKPPVFPAIS